MRDASEALHLARQVDSLPAQAFAENALAHTLLAFGEFGPALAHAQSAQRIANEIEHQQWVVASSSGLGRIYALLLAPEPAVSILEAALSLAHELGSRFWVATLTANLARAYILIDDAALRDQFVRAALDALPKDKPPRPREAAKQAFGGLTAREREVAALIAQGKTSREIADLLVVSERTAEVHVSNILAKLGFSSRAQIAAWAVEKGLAKH